jgi:PAN domain
MSHRFGVANLLCMTLLLGCAIAPLHDDGLEQNTDRPGMDIRTITLQDANPALCRSACLAESQCQSFTHVKPRFQGGPAQCLLKSGTPGPIGSDCCTSGLRPSVTPQTARSVLYRWYQEWLARPVLFVSTTGRHDTLAEYAAKCDAATGITVPAFTCDSGVSPGGQGNGQVCDRPNVLNGECDPGSKFQVLPGRTQDAVAVAHCRKQGNGPGFFGDIAVIQHNKLNGATCFYQALGVLPGNNVPSPRSMGSTPNSSASWADGVEHWISPRGTEAIGCTACHDSGAFIRSPYLAQLTAPPHALPSTADGYANLDTPLTYVGLDYMSNRSWSISTSNAFGDNGLSCTTCHRVAVNNHESVRSGEALGTGLLFANLATAATQSAKNPHGANSPIWMRPGQGTFNAAAEASASKLRACAQGFRDSNFTVAPAGCSVAALAVPYQDPPPHDNPIECRVWDDSGWQSHASEAIYLAGPNRSCVPDGTGQGACGRWFGRCKATRSGADVGFRIFNDGDTQKTALADGVYPRAPSQSCIADGSATGNCRRWFGALETSDGYAAECYLFDDGLRNWIGPTRAILFGGPGSVCMPDGTGTGQCRKWFGNCQVTAERVPVPVPVQSVSCQVWDDSGWQSGRSGAVYFAGPNRACVPDSTPQGSCGRWFGRCVADVDGSDVNFSVFDDGSSNQTAPSDGVYVRAPRSACVADGTATGSCRRWFGAPVTSDGRRASCYLFDDGGANRIGPTDALYYRSPSQVCMPDGTATGACRKWFGDCEVPRRSP